MSLLNTVMEKVVPHLPGPAPDPMIGEGGAVGQPMSRVDGTQKVAGEATFSAEFKLDNLAYAALVYSTIAKGKITKIDASEAERAAGVIHILSHENAPSVKVPPMADPNGGGGAANSTLPIFKDATVYWNGQPVVLVVAQTQDQAEHAASLVKVEYQAEPPDVSFDALKSEAQVPSIVLTESPEVEVGHAEKALAAAPVQLDRVYRTPRYNHNAIEPHASIAAWSEDGALTIYDTTQNLGGVSITLATMFSIKPDKVRVISPFVGGAFGGKGSMWFNTAMCAIAAKVVGRPVKLALSREGVFRIVGGRTTSEQRVALGTDASGRLQSLIHSGTTATTSYNNFAEQFTFPARHLYASPNLLVSQKVVNLDTVANTYMRAPGESIGNFALESALDELALELKIDPIELRRLNEPWRDPTENTEFSMRNLTEAYRRGAEKFGWNNAAPQTQRDGKWLIGQGVATAYYPFYRFAGSARVRIRANGSAIVAAAAHEMGMGTATVQTQHAARRLGLPVEKITFEYGDSDLPQSPQAGGSNQTASIIASVRAAVEKAQNELLALAGKDADSPLHKLKLEEVEARDGGLWSKAEPGKGETYAAILERVNQEHVEAEATSVQPMELMKYSMHSYGAQFCEVRVHEETGETRVSRWLGSFDCGTILNHKTASSQFRGGIIMGIGMALTEETLFDERSGRIINPSLAEYHVPVNLDVPDIEILSLDIPDPHAPLGAHGIGEIGITGVAAAIANAVFNATGKRIRELPITLDKLM